MYQFVYLIKAIAAVLITNSHFDDLYPIAAMSVGGSLGNALFFLVSGFLISTKIDIGPFRWYLKRCMRIYPAYWIINLAYWGLGFLSISTCKEAVGRFILPVKSFWFIGAILIFYAVFYFVIYSGRQRCIHWIMLTTIVNFVVYIFVKDTSYWSIEDSGYFKFIFYFDVMVFGYAIKLNFEKIKKSVKQYRKACVIGSVVSLACFFMIKIIMTKIPRLFCIQFLVQVATLLFAIFTFLTALSLENTLSKWKKCVFGKILLCIADSTLEIYLVNYIIANWAKKFYFPVNIILAFILIFSVGVVLHYCINICIKKISEQLGAKR